MNLLAEGGYPALTMEKVAARAGVGKATVYRRWKTRSDLAADALHSTGIIAEQTPVEHGPGQLRLELIDTISQLVRLDDMDRVGLAAALFETAREQPELCEIVRTHYLASIQDTIDRVVDNAAARGDISAPPTDRPRIETSAVVALLVHWRVLRNSTAANDSDVTEIVDRILMPLYV